MVNCIFCKIVKGEIPSKKVYEDKEVIAFHDINPIAPVHILLIPKRHIDNLATVHNTDKDVLGACQLAASRVARKEGIGGSFRLLTASGKEAGQSVFHLHYHLIGGWKDKAPIMGVKKDIFH